MKFTCITCGQKMEVPDNFVGTDVKCPICQTVNVVPPNGILSMPPKRPTIRVELKRIPSFSIGRTTVIIGLIAITIVATVFTINKLNRIEQNSKNNNTYQSPQRNLARIYPQQAYQQPQSVYRPPQSQQYRGPQYGPIVNSRQRIYPPGHQFYQQNNLIVQAPIQNRNQFSETEQIGNHQFHYNFDATNIDAIKKLKEQYKKDELEKQRLATDQQIVLERVKATNELFKITELARIESKRNETQRLEEERMRQEKAEVVRLQEEKEKLIESIPAEINQTFSFIEIVGGIKRTNITLIKGTLDGIIYKDENGNGGTLSISHIPLSILNSCGYNTNKINVYVQVEKERVKAKSIQSQQPSVVQPTQPVYQQPSPQELMLRRYGIRH